MKKKIIFLDFDGVINTLFFDEEGQLHYGARNGEKVNNFQAINWLNMLNIEIPFDIVITSTWRIGKSKKDLADILYNSGLSRDIQVIGKTPSYNRYINTDYSFYLFGHYFSRNTRRGREIDLFIKQLIYFDKELYNKYDFKDFIILDDDNDMWKYKKNLIKCTDAGFTINEYGKCVRRWNKNERKGLFFRFKK